MKKSDLLRRNVIERRKRLRCNINELKECQEEINSLRKRVLADEFEVNKRYNQVKEPLFEKRSQLMHRLNKSWASIFQCHPTFSHSCDGNNESCSLKYLQNFILKYDPEPDPKSQVFTLYFQFNENPYFCNDELWKKYKVDDSSFKSTKSSKIEWKANFEPKPLNGSEHACKKMKLELGVNCGFLQWLSDNDSGCRCDVTDVIFYKIWQNPGDFEKKFKKRLTHHVAQVRRQNDVGVDVDTGDELDIESYADTDASSFDGEFAFEDDDMSENGYDSNASIGSWDFDD